MLGNTVREARIKKGLTQARLAKLAGVSRRHLAALEKGANVSIGILQRVATVLELTEIPMGDLAFRSSDKDRSVNLPLLTDTIREARLEAERAQVTLARAASMLGAAEPLAMPERHGGFERSFPRLPVRRLEPGEYAAGNDLLRERPDLVELETSGEIRHGEAMDESVRETIQLPRDWVDTGELVFRARGSEMQESGIHDGDLLIVELRPRGRASNGELVIGKIGRVVFVGRWWDKHGRKALMSNGMAEVTLGRSTRSLKVVGAINQVLRQ